MSVKKEAIITAALELFMEKGYENTSIRMIQSKVGSEVGLFYYYFKDKDAVFEQALNMFFDGYRPEFDSIIAFGRRNPTRLMTEFFETLGRETDMFRQKYADKLHWTVRRAIREQTLEFIEPYLAQIVDILICCGATTKIDKEVAVMFLTHGVGSMILHKNKEQYIQKKPEIIKGINLIMGLESEISEVFFPAVATEVDIPACVTLAQKNAEYFPGFEQADFESKLSDYVECGEAFVVRLHGEVQGLVLYSIGDKSIDFLLRDSGLKGFGVGGRLLETAVARFPVGEKITVITFQDGDKKGKAARKLYQRFGFTEQGTVKIFDESLSKMELIVPAEAPNFTKNKMN